MSVSVAHASEDEVDEVIGAVEDVISGRNPAHCVMAFLALAIILQKPQASREEVIDGVKGASEWIALYLSQVDENEGKDGSEITLN